MKRRGLSLVETIVALAILVVAGVGLLVTSQGETKGVIHTKERYTAEILLGELEAAFGGKALEFYQTRGFPPPPQDPSLDTFTDLHRSLFLEHPTITGMEPPSSFEDSDVSKALRKSMKAMQVKRSIFVEELTGGQNLTAGLVTFRVSYVDRAEKPRSLSRHEVIYPARAP